ncbi:hypothetical protein J437_LFUL004249 [Ladona fulva]|uniref:THAP4-like heme-binding domain-containing protein n=1 Tax=Ladona fulva TaxID=123851 RepID=A0A8K0JZV8_LADFU|nr:hypothetical protein J437_LFUL004249 [Ladona fulva]
MSVVEEGKVDGFQLSLLSTGITRMSFTKGSTVVKTHRSISLEDSKLKQVISMETGDQAMTEHLSAIYVKIN